jgi:protein-disulfide isomerase
MDTQHPKPFLETVPSKTAFLLGFVSAILVLGTIGFIVLGACLLGSGCNLPVRAALTEDQPSNPNPPAQPTTQPTAPANKPAAVTDEDHVLGDKKAIITMIEYSDFECPFCDRFHPTTKQILEAYPGKVRLVFRHFPLSFHANAESAAVASECAAEQGKFWEFADKLFANQDKLGADFYKQTAKELKLNSSKFDTCLSTNKYLEKVRKQAQEGAGAGITGTPGTFLIDKNGNIQTIKGAQPFESVKSQIDAMLKS